MNLLWSIWPWGLKSSPLAEQVFPVRGVCCAFSGLWSLWMSWPAATCPHTSHETPPASPTRERALCRQIHVRCLYVPFVSTGAAIVCSLKWTRGQARNLTPTSGGDTGITALSMGIYPSRGVTHPESPPAAPTSLLSPHRSVPPSWGRVRPSLSQEELSILPFPMSFVSASEERTWDIPSRTGRT